jgi:hypothetical protein
LCGCLTRVNQSGKVLGSMRFKRATLIAGVSLLLVPTVFAHHALQAQFDMGQTIALTGAVTKMDWSNPHVRLYIEVKKENKTVTWELYMGSPNQQIMNGWKIDTYRRGDRVSVDAYPARDGSNVGFAKTVKVISSERTGSPLG